MTQIPELSSDEPERVLAEKGMIDLGKRSGYKYSYEGKIIDKKYSGRFGAVLVQEGEKYLLWNIRDYQHTLFLIDLEKGLAGEVKRTWINSPLTSCLEIELTGLRQEGDIAVINYKTNGQSYEERYKMEAEEGRLARTKLLKA